MTLAAQRILIIGGGFSGMAAALQLRKQGAAVDLVEVDPGWRSYGAGISLGGATLRAFDQLGILDTFLRHGAATNGVNLRLPHGAPLATLPTPPLARPDVAGSAGILRPVLARLLADATRASGTNVRLGCSFTAIEPMGDSVEVSFTDGTHARYDLVIGADGLYSKTRAAVMPEAPAPRYSGQAVWRAVLPRQPGLDTVTLWMGGPVKPGVNPVSADEMYLFVTEHRPVNAHVDEASFLPTLQRLLEPFPDPALQTIRTQLADPAHAARIVFRPLEGLLVPGPWHRGRVVLIGDAVHATTPHLASGACIGIEDAIVLAEELGRSPSISTALDAFHARRWERCRLVVENSARLGQIEMEGGSKEEHAQITRETLGALAQPI